MTMSFGLKNARATYQQAIQECLEKEIQDDLVEAYVDDVVVKTKESHSLIDDLTRTFVALNPVPMVAVTEVLAQLLAMAVSAPAF
jgi:hypothetical protein